MDTPLPPPASYSAERRLRQQQLRGIDGGSSNDVFNAVSALHDEMSKMRAEMVEMKASIDRAHAAALPSPDDKDMQISQFRTELRALALAIVKTKAEIAAIRPRGNLVVVANELDAVVVATEDATQEIIDSVEAVNAMVEELREKSQDSHLEDVVEEIQNRMMKVLESCNFQDITGQRITKVVRTMKHVEERINAMISIWGEDDVMAESLAGQVSQTADQDAGLLNGPQLSGAGCSQDDIDQLFE